MTVDLDELECAANAIRPDQRGVPAFSAEDVLALIARLREAEREIASKHEAFCIAHDQATENGTKRRVAEVVLDHIRGALDTAEVGAGLVMAAARAKAAEAERDRLKAGLDEARSKVASWMTERSFATGHGETLDDLLSELAFSVAEIRAARDRLKAERDEAMGELTRLTFAARTSGETAGRDEHLCGACDAAEAVIAKHGGSDGNQG